VHNALRLALVVNVLLVCYSSNLVRDNLVVPWLAVSGDDCSVEESQEGNPVGCDRDAAHVRSCCE